MALVFLPLLELGQAELLALHILLEAVDEIRVQVAVQAAMHSALRALIKRRLDANGVKILGDGHVQSSYQMLPAPGV